MSFDVFLQRFKDGDSAEADRQAVRDVLARATYQRPDDCGFYLVTFADGVEVEFSAGDLEADESFTDCAFHLRGFGEDLMAFMLEVARAGDMVMLPAMEGNPVILVAEEQAKHLPREVLESFRPVVVGTAAELGAVLCGGFDGWSRYRDQVVRGSDDEDGA